MTHELIQPHSLHQLLEVDYGSEGDERLRALLNEGANAEERCNGETPLHVASRRRRASAVRILIEAGADVDAKTDHGKTAYAHALRRGFYDVLGILSQAGAEKNLDPADELATTVQHEAYEAARQVLKEHPNAARTGNPEEDRLLPDVAGGQSSERVRFLIAAGANLSARGLDGGTALHQACWFGRPLNAKLLIEAGAPLGARDTAHDNTALGWAVHGSRFSGGAAEHQDAYVALVRLLFEATPRMLELEAQHGESSEACLHRLLRSASDAIAEMLRTLATAE